MNTTIQIRRWFIWWTVAQTYSLSDIDVCKLTWRSKYPNVPMRAIVRVE